MYIRPGKINLYELRSVKFEETVCSYFNVSDTTISMLYSISENIGYSFPDVVDMNKDISKMKRRFVKQINILFWKLLQKANRDKHVK